jgi:hypothetical protein
MRGGSMRENSKQFTIWFGIGLLIVGLKGCGIL